MNTDYQARVFLDAIKETPDEGRHVLVALDDTATDVVLATEMIATEAPWISYKPDPDHCGHLILKLLAKIPYLKEMLDRHNTLASHVRDHHVTIVLCDKYSREILGNLITHRGRRRSRKDPWGPSSPK